VRPVHDCVPLVLSPEQIDEWLNPRERPVSPLLCANA